MIYVNRKFNKEEREFSYGVLNCIALGEKGRGRKEVLLPVPKSLEKIEKGINKNLTIGLTKNGKPRINYISPKNSEEFVYAIIDSYNGYSRRCDGTVRIMQNGIEELVIANGADGDAGRIGSWEVKLLKIPNDGLRRFTRLVGSGRSEDIDGYIISKGEDITFVQRYDIESYFDMIDEEMPNLFKTDICFNRFVFSADPFEDIKGCERDLYNILKDIEIVNKRDLLRYNRFFEKNGRIIHIDNDEQDNEYLHLHSNLPIDVDRYLIISSEQRDAIRNILPNSLRYQDSTNKLELCEKDTRYIYPTHDYHLGSLKYILEFYIENNML